MSELGDLLELMHRAGRGFDTVFAEYRIWTHNARSAEAHREATAAMHPATGQGRQVTATATAGGGAGSSAPSGESERVIRLWIAGDDRAREEQESPHFSSYAVVSGGQWWSYSDSFGALTNDPGSGTSHQIGGEVKALLDPFGVTGLLELKPLGNGERAGRAVALARGRPRPRTFTPHVHIVGMALHMLGRGADEWLLEIDAERGSLLRVEARRQGEPFQISEAVRIVFDEPIAPEKFVFEPPEGVPVEPISVLGGRHQVSIGEAIETASFKVFLLERVPNDWSLTINVHPGRERMGIKPNVTLFYRSADVAAELAVSQTPTPNGFDAPTSPPPAPQWEDIEHEGMAMKVVRRVPPRQHTQVGLVRDGTQIILTSHSMSTEALLDAATRLVPARRPA